MSTVTLDLRKQRFRAHSIMCAAIARGDLVRADHCERCGKSKVDNGYALDGHHHLGYDYPLVVQWLCRRCHRKVHNRAGDGWQTRRERYTPEEISAQTRPAVLASIGSLSPDRKAENSRRGARSYWDSKTQDERSHIQRAKWAKLTPQERTLRARKGQCTRRHGEECECWKEPR